jgi:hypothetical protein
MVSGETFSSEKILIPSHMQKAHELLNSSSLMVSIARRTCMMIIAADAESELFDLFLKIHNYTWDDDSYDNPQIVNAIFNVVDGVINNMYVLKEE